MIKASYDQRLTIKSIDGLQLEGFQWGDLDAERGVFLCLHGLSSHALWFDALGCVLTQLGYCVVAVNRRGSGGSDGQRMHAENLTVLFDDLDQWMNLFENTQRVTCLGHCWGAMLAKKWQDLREPNIVESIYVAPPYKTIFDKKWHPWALKILAVFASSKRVNLPYGAEVFSNDKEVVARIKNDEQFHSSVSLGLLKITNKLKLIADDFADSRIIVAEKDKLVNYSWSRSVKVRIVKDAGHALIIEHTQSIADLITESW